MIWFNYLIDGSVVSQKELCDSFAAHFNTQKWKLVTKVIFSSIMEKKKETMREFINRFTKVIVEVIGTYDKLKCWIFKKGIG